MNFNFRNISENPKRIRIIPKNGAELVANIGVDNPTATIDEDGIFSVCLSAPIICEWSSSIVLTNEPYRILDLSRWGVAPTMDLYINDNLVLTNTSQFVYDIGGYESEMRSIQGDYGFEAYGGCGNVIYITNVSNEPISFRMVYKTTGSYGDFHPELPKNYLIPTDGWFEHIEPHGSTDYNPDAGYLTFTLCPPDPFEV